MVITVDEYNKITDYIMHCSRGGQVNQPRLDLCRWIIEKVADGTITLEES